MLRRSRSLDVMTSAHLLQSVCFSLFCSPLKTSADQKQWSFYQPGIQLNHWGPDFYGELHLGCLQRVRRDCDVWNWSLLGWNLCYSPTIQCDSCWGTSAWRRQVHCILFEVSFILNLSGVGLILGGGYSWIADQYGLGVDNVVSYDLVMPNGTFVTVSNTSYPEILFGLKGGLNNFGIISGVTMYARPMGSVWVCWFIGIRDFIPLTAPTLLGWGNQLRSFWSGLPSRGKFQFIQYRS